MIELISLHKIGGFFIFSKFLDFSKTQDHGTKIKFSIFAPWCYFRIFTVQKLKIHTLISRFINKLEFGSFIRKTVQAFTVILN